MTDLPLGHDHDHDHAELERLARRRRARAVRGVAVLVVVVAAVIFVVQNSQPVKVHLWLVTGHPRLIWVVLASLVVGIGRASCRERVYHPV